jgi:molybdate transport system substrate-binding protein
MLLVALAAGCAPSSYEGDNAELVVFAASSLTDPFTEIGQLFEDSHPGVRITLNFLASSDLAAQIEQGAPADVFASADEANMQRVIDAGLVAGPPEAFARNALQIIVPSGNPGEVHSLFDLENPDLVVVLCAEECPAGRYAAEVFDKAGVQVSPDSLEAEVKAVASRVELGEADAAIVYVTDVLAAGDDVEGIEIPARYNVTATYSIARLVEAPEGAQAFIDVVLSPEGRAVLEQHGFLVP